MGRINYSYWTILLVLLIARTGHAQPKKISLFLPQEKTKWHIYLEKSSLNDPKQVFKFEDNAWHASGEDFGYMITNRKFKNFHLVFEFRWGEKKYPPREKAKRDAGVLYLVDLYSGDKIWPRSLEFQIQEGDCGDFWMTDSTTISFHGVQTEPKNWLRGEKLVDAEKPTGQWNTVEVIVNKGKITHILNGKVVNEGSNPSVKEGNILIQSEGAEIYYRNLIVTEL
jgi:Domain of Unknown Function (DUF1080)